MGIPGTLSLNWTESYWALGPCLAAVSTMHRPQKEMWRAPHYSSGLGVHGVFAICSCVLQTVLASGYDIFQRDPLGNMGSAQPKLESNAAWEPTLRQGCFYLLVFVPITCALLQLLSWSQFSLHGRRLQTVKSQRQSPTQLIARDQNNLDVPEPFGSH